ncbi:MAG TPA: DUF58 domain-containing protein [Methanocella sp.]|jgi:uncharacterized protein (DUF58 family)
MELKDAAIALGGITVILLAMGLFTNGLVFYAASLIALAALAIDLIGYQLLIGDLKRNLTVTRGLSARQVLLGTSITITYDLDYDGSRDVPLTCVQPVDGGYTVDDPVLLFNMYPGRQSITFAARPYCRGTCAIEGLRMMVESRLFRGTMIAGGESKINVYVPMGQDRTGTDTRRGRVHRLSLPGSEALRRGSGSDFSHIRDFTPGDSTRNIDWARSSRSPTLIVRDFEDEHTLPLMVLIDVDPSMDTGTTKTELESAVELAAILASQVLLENERMGIACFSRSDVTGYRPPAGGKAQMAYIRNMLSAVKAVEGDSTPRTGLPTLQEADAVRRMFSEAAKESGVASIMEETIRQFGVNVREDGFIKAIARASQSTGTPCSIVVITNLSMGLTSLLNGIRIATYYGHNVSVALTPHIWYDGGSDNPEKCFDRYRQAKDTISRLRGSRVTVVELSACENAETILYHGRARTRADIAGQEK